MKNSDNPILNFFLKNIDLEIFNIFKKKTFIAGYVLFFAFGIFFIYSETKQCQIKGTFKLNPLYTPGKILDNEMFLIRSVSKYYPSIQWYKEKFEVKGPIQIDGTSFCEKQIVKFAGDLEKEYASIVRNSMAIYDEVSFDLDINEIFQDESVLRERAILKRNQDRARQIALNQVEKLIDNPDKYTLDWSNVDQLNGVSILKQLILMTVYAFIFAIFFTTGIDLIILIRSVNK